MSPIGKPAAKQGDRVVAIDTHMLMTPSPAGAVPTPTPMPFNGVLAGSLANSVLLEDKPAATEGSTADNTPAHLPTGGSFLRPPSNQGSIASGSATVLIENKPAAHSGDPAMTCNDPADTPGGIVIGSGTVLVGD